MGPSFICPCRTVVTKTDVALAAGPQVLRLVIDAAGPSGIVGNFNWLRLR